MKLNDTFFGSWKIDRRIGSGSYGSVYRLKKNDFGEDYYSAMKVISVSESDIADDCVKSFTNEFSIMSKLKGNSNIVSYEDHEIVKHEEDSGFDILIRMEYLEPVLRYEKKNGFTEDDIIKLGLDMCTALELCENAGIIHPDIKPENIFVSPNGDFKLGDFGISRTLERTASLSRKGTFAYMAPEVYKGEDYGVTADIYSLGIVLYRFLHAGRLPFVSSASASAEERENAVKRRLSGEKIPDGGSDFMKIILKACSYKPSDRYLNASEMKADILSYQKKRDEEKKKPPQGIENNNALMTVMKVLIALFGTGAVILIVLLLM